MARIHSERDPHQAVSCCSHGLEYTDVNLDDTSQSRDVISTRCVGLLQPERGLPFHSKAFSQEKDNPK